ncbi:MAG: hypothetical protein JRI23_13695 [Deltaproteobacteria bacterium]|jgi:hypothetical protein|nr:hypothetical protein [Deltaproteobacteria bacterium]MBW2532782.1 hypothetical protein [Deltaproteobacteria bacterium]
MAAATAVILDQTHPEMIVERRREGGSVERRQLQTRVDQLERKNRVLAQRIRELERELMLARLESGELSPPSAITNTQTAEVWLAWARNNHHTDACACHRCSAARRAL